MNVAVESHIPFIKGKLEAAGHCVEYLTPEEFTRHNIRQADALIVRTRTRCDASLLDDTNVKKIATATIGTDHIDTDYCARRGIEVHNAPGCNAPAVAQYVLASLGSLGITDATIGIVGVGHVGSIVDRWARANGYKTLLCDPPLGKPATLRDIAENSDVITFHTPLDASTFHMADAEFFAACRRTPLIINAARGAIVDTPALIDALKSGAVRGAVIDCWEGEPAISRELLDLSAIATPHIAGYSLQGKRRATAMALAAIDPTLHESLDPVAPHPTLAAILSTYNPLTDTALLKQTPTAFEPLRNTYPLRPEPVGLEG